MRMASLFKAYGSTEILLTSSEVVCCVLGMGGMGMGDGRAFQLDFAAIGKSCLGQTTRFWLGVVWKQAGLYSSRAASFNSNTFKYT